jgi:hypothetical protein
MALRGGAIGALGGVAFTLLMGPPAGDFLRMLSMAIPAFGLIGLVGADRVFVAQERMYQSMLEAGAQVPAQKPEMRMADRGPAIAVAIAAAIIAGFILVLIIMASTGAL